MARDTFQRVLEQLQDEVLLLGSRVEQAILDAVGALSRRDMIAARTIYEYDEAINEKRFAIENAVLIQIATQQPMAHDLRCLVAILEIVNELERMGDYAKGITKVIFILKEEDIFIPDKDFNRMAELGVEMLHDGLQAFLHSDAQAARKIAEKDDAVDDLYNQVYHKLVAAMIADPEIIDPTNYLMWVAHNLERLADRVVNICERTIFAATGELFELDTEEEMGV